MHRRTARGRAERLGVLVAAAAVCTCSDPERPPGGGDPYRLAVAFPNLVFARPVHLAEIPDGEGRLCVLEQAGRIRVFDARRDVAAADLFLDLESFVRSAHNEEGLLGLAFHPQYATNGFFYVYHSMSDPLRNVVARYRVEGGIASPQSRHVVLEIPKPFGNHNGGTLVFGSDGFLYLSVGDGGSGGDPEDNAQNLGTLLGKILRIDVDRRDPGLEYAVPLDNPFAGRPGARGEIWAWGLRNVWRMSFDRANTDLWAGDVGQGSWEEIDRIERGGNYGWDLREGRHPFESGPSPGVPLVDPVWEYGRDLGSSITGGHVYRGSRHPELHGAYVYADFVSGTVWALRTAPVPANRTLVRQPRNIASFGETAAGELYLLAFDGRIHELEAVAP